MPLFGAGGVIKIAGSAIKAVVNRARSKRAEKKLKRSKKKEQEAVSALSQKLGLSASAVESVEVRSVGGGALDEKLKEASATPSGKNKVWYIIAAAAGVIVLFFMFKKK